MVITGKSGGRRKIGPDAGTGKFIPVDKAENKPKTNVVGTVKPKKEVEFERDRDCFRAVIGGPEQGDFEDSGAVVV